MPYHRKPDWCEVEGCQDEYHLKYYGKQLCLAHWTKYVEVEERYGREAARRLIGLPTPKTAPRDPRDLH